jgi:hypothetical protein
MITLNFMNFFLYWIGLLLFLLVVLLNLFNFLLLVVLISVGFVSRRGGVTWSQKLEPSVLDIYWSIQICLLESLLPSLLRVTHNYNFEIL